tara:strand:- start:8963 stop:9568 length:606 start_codon:yes stop_codon:yes gene_type:complete
MLKPKQKKCKGTGKAKGFGCGKLTAHRTYGLGKMCCWSKWLLESENGKEYLQKATLKVTAPRKEFEAFKKERKERIGLTALLESVKNVCHKYIRLRDENKPCISCQMPYQTNHQAGHFYKAELFSLVRFNEFNINGQCEQCNLRREGNESEYRINLPNRIGLENFKELNKIASFEKRTNHKWDRQNLIEIRNYYKKKIKEL